MMRGTFFLHLFPLGRGDFSVDVCLISGPACLAALDGGLATVDPIRSLLHPVAGTIDRLQTAGLPRLRVNSGFSRKIVKSRFTLIECRLTRLSCSRPFIGETLTQFCGLFTRVCGRLALVGDSLSLVGQRLAFTGDAFASVGGLLSSPESLLALVDP